MGECRNICFHPAIMEWKQDTPEYRPGWAERLRPPRRDPDEVDAGIRHVLFMRATREGIKQFTENDDYSIQMLIAEMKEIRQMLARDFRY